MHSRYHKKKQKTHDTEKAKTKLKLNIFFQITLNNKFKYAKLY